VSLFQVMALPFLPAEHIAPAFARLKEQSVKIPQLYSWVDYVESTWITNTTFPVESWSVFRKSVRTNNDVEGWHRRINAKAGKANLPFYVLVSLLYDEATAIVTQIQLVSEKKLRRCQKKKKHKKMQGRIFSVWEEYQNGVISSKFTETLQQHIRSNN
jgi:hypothetical protein